MGKREKSETCTTLQTQDGKQHVENDMACSGTRFGISLVCHV